MTTLHFSEMVVSWYNTAQMQFLTQQLHFCKYRELVNNNGIQENMLLLCVIYSLFYETDISENSINSNRTSFLQPSLSHVCSRAAHFHFPNLYLPY